MKDIKPIPIYGCSEVALILKKANNSLYDRLDSGDGIDKTRLDSLKVRGSILGRVISSGYLIPEENIALTCV